MPYQYIKRAAYVCICYSKSLFKVTRQHIFDLHFFPPCRIFCLWFRWWFLADWFVWMLSDIYDLNEIPEEKQPKFTIMVCERSLLMVAKSAPASISISVCLAVCVHFSASLFRSFPSRMMQFFMNIDVEMKYISALKFPLFQRVFYNCFRLSIANAFTCQTNAVCVCVCMYRIDTGKWTCLNLFKIAMIDSQIKLEHKHCVFMHMSNVITQFRAHNWKWGARKSEKID